MQAGRCRQACQQAIGGELHVDINIVARKITQTAVYGGINIGLDRLDVTSLNRHA